MLLGLELHVDRFMCNGRHGIPIARIHVSLISAGERERPMIAIGWANVTYGVVTQKRPVLLRGSK